MKLIRNISLLFAIIAISFALGCGGGGGGGSTSSGTTFSGVVTTQDTTAKILTLTFLTKDEISTPIITSPIGYIVTGPTLVGGKYQYTVTGIAIPNATSSNITQKLTLTYLLNGVPYTYTLNAIIKPNDLTVTKVVATYPTTLVNGAVKLEYSYLTHLITVTSTLEDKYKNDTLTYEWHVDSKTGYQLKNTDSIFTSAEFIYRPDETTYIPADITTGSTRVYNRGFKVEFQVPGTPSTSILKRNLYLIVKTSSDNKEIGALKFYVALPKEPNPPT